MSFNSRRQFLRGLCQGAPIALALPSLVSLLPRAAQAQTSPMNFFFMYVANGTFPHTIQGQKVQVDHAMSRWFPPVGDLPASLPLMLKRLEPNRSDFSVISGLRAPISDGNVTKGPHITTSRMLTANRFGAGAGFSSNLEMIKAGHSPTDSIDQLIGAKLAGSNLSAEIQKQAVYVRLRTVPGGDSEISPWSNKLCFKNNTHAPGFSSPKKLFDSVFGQGQQLPTGSKPGVVSALDYLLDDIHRAQNLASTEDRHILDRWLTGYQELKAKVDMVEQPQAPGSCSKKPAVPAATLDAANEQVLLESYDAIYTLFLDIFLAAMECGSRRVFTLLTQSEARSGFFLDKALSTTDLHSEGGQSITLNDMAVDPHIGMAHYGKQGDPILKYLRLVSLNNYYMRKYKYVIDGLKQRSLFNNSLAVCSYSTRDGNHDSGDGDFPFLVAGNGGGFKTGKHHRLTKLNPNQCSSNASSVVSNLTPVANFWVSVLKKYGLSYVDPFANGNLDQLFT